jgi:hypothetical protein
MKSKLAIVTAAALLGPTLFPFAATPSNYLSNATIRAVERRGSTPEMIKNQIFKFRETARRQTGGQKKLRLSDIPICIPVS